MVLSTFMMLCHYCLFKASMSPVWWKLDPSVSTLAALLHPNSWPRGITLHSVLQLCGVFLSAEQKVVWA